MCIQSIIEGGSPPLMNENSWPTIRKGVTVKSSSMVNLKNGFPRGYCN